MPACWQGAARVIYQNRSEDLVSTGQHCYNTPNRQVVRRAGTARPTFLKFLCIYWQAECLQFKKGNAFFAMRLQGIKIRLTIIVGSLLLTSMLLVNFVLIIFWQRDALQREITRDQAVLARVLDRLPSDISALHGVSPDFFSFADFYPRDVKGRILLSTGSENPAASTRSDSFTPRYHRG